MKAIIDDFLSPFRADLRITALKKIARDNNWSFTARRKFNKEPIALLPFSLFEGNQEKRLKGIVNAGAILKEGNLRIYDYVYYGSFNNTVTTVFECYHPKFDLTPFAIRPKGRLAAIKDFFVAPENLFLTIPEFNERYEFSTENKEALKIDLNEGFLDLVADEAGWVYEGHDDFLIAYQPNIPLSYQQILPAFQRFQKMSDQLLNGISGHELV